jgi:hypothetical protein
MSTYAITEPDGETVIMSPTVAQGSDGSDYTLVCAAQIE